MHNIYLCIIPKETFIGIFIEGSMNVGNNCILFLSIFSSFYLHFIYALIFPIIILNICYFSFMNFKLYQLTLTVILLNRITTDINPEKVRYATIISFHFKNIKI